MGVEMGARMTVLDTADGLLVHSPVAVPPESVTPLGQVRWVLSPNLFHHLYVGPWIEAGIEAWAAPGLDAKRPDLSFAGVVEPDTRPFGDDIALQVLTCLPITNEVVVLHRPSGTLVVTDLLFNIPRSAPWSTRFAMRCLGGYPGCKTTLLERMKIRKDAAREQLGTIASWSFDRLIMAHGEPIETGGKDAFVAAFDWLGLP